MPNRPDERPDVQPVQRPDERPQGPDIDLGTQHPGPAEVGAPGTVPREGADRIPHEVGERIREEGGAPITDMPKF